jgi:hypothetical protein
MRSDEDIDSLALEIQKHTKIRPTTTGEIGFTDRHKTTLQRLGNADSRIRSTLVPTTVDDDHTFRPRAPRSRQRETQPSEAETIDKIILANNSQQKDAHCQPKIDDQNIAKFFDKLERLQYFSQTNRSRELSAEADSIHYVNISQKGNNSASSGSTSDEKASLFQRKNVTVESATGKISLVSNTAFNIPQLPTGKLLTFNILSTWGDPHYLGLMGIEIFDAFGRPATIMDHQRQIKADPADINSLPEYNNDPRVVQNLLDGVNLTCDDMHAWLAPFTSGRNHYIWLELDHVTTISMIRIWNYNKSRIHSYRGARYLEISFDKVPIFKGEIRQASGSHSIRDYESSCECILFTMDSSILDLIEKYDPIVKQFEEDASEKYDRHGVPLSEIPSHRLLETESDTTSGKDFKRPMSFVKNHPSIIQQSPVAHATDYQPQLVFSPDRPSTAAGRRSIRRIRATDNDIQLRDSSISNEKQLHLKKLTRPSTANYARSQRPLTVHMIELKLKSSWGSTIGIIGIHDIIGIDEHMREFALPMPSLFFAESTERGTNMTPLSPLNKQIRRRDDDNHNQWELPYHPSCHIVMQFKFQQKILVKVKSSSHSCCLYLDNVLSQSFVRRVFAYGTIMASGKKLIAGFDLWIYLLMGSLFPR